MRQPGSEGIAIVGMACVFPGAHSPEELWQNVLAGRRYFRRMPAERLPREDYYDPNPDAPLRTYADQMALISGWRFDPIEFRIPPISVRASDITHWMALHTARAALADAGIDLSGADRTRIGVALGNSLTGEFARSHNLQLRWPYVERALRASLAQSGIAGPDADALVEGMRHYYQSPLPDATEDLLAGNMSNTIAGRIAGYFDLGGGAYTIDGACSSSLLSIATACNALVNGELDYTLAGGVDVSLDPFEIVGFAKARALAASDIRPYDEQAQGMLPGEGCGLFVLARERDARAAGVPIHAVIRGWGYSSDGAGSITAPRIEGQARALENAYRRAGYSIADVGLIEGHGTGTTLGDKVELTAILGLLDAAEAEAPCAIGSIKGNIGHCKAAAGAAGLVKAVMALKRRIIPPTMNCERPNSVFGRPQRHLRPATGGSAWVSQRRPRRASVSAMGFGGANTHVTLEEALPGDAISAEDLALLGSDQPTELILIAGADAGDLVRQIDALLPVVDRICRAELTDMGAELAARRPSGPARVAIIARSPWHLAEVLREVKAHIDTGGSLDSIDRQEVMAGTILPHPRLAALFPGQGAQRLTMGAHLHRRHPFVRDAYESIEAVTAGVLPNPLLSYVLRDRWTADDSTVHAWKTALDDTRIAQPAIVAASLATLRLLERMGLVPDVHLGHSLGEITALAAAGSFSDADAVRVAALRGGAMADLDLDDPGAMLAITAEAGRVAELIAASGADAVISNENSPRQTVASGATSAIAVLQRACERTGLACRRIAVSHAFHSGIVAPAAEALSAALRGVPVAQPGRMVVSSCTGDVLEGNVDVRTLLSEHVRKRVRFVDAITRTASELPTLWIEIGPGSILTGLVRDTLGKSGARCLPTDVEGENGFDLLNRVYAAAFVQGLPLASDRLFDDRFHRPIRLEGYDPQLIVNPCERPVSPPAEPVALASLPALSLRARESVAPDAAPAHDEQERHGERVSPDTIQAFAIEWISSRTGFPADAITPGMRLRDDLNLDSIKVGELTIALSRKLGSELAGDPAAIANASIDALIAMLIDRRDPATGDEIEADRLASYGVVSGMPAWVRTFGTTSVECPLAVDGTPLRRGVPVAFISPGDDPLSRGIAATVHGQGLRLVIPDPAALETIPAPKDLAGMVIVLPSLTGAFVTTPPEAFEDRIRMIGERIFHALRWGLAGRRGGGFRVVVVRQAGPSSQADDLDGGAGLLRTFYIETPDSSAKWLRVPDNWTPERVGEVVVRELNTPGCGFFEYDAEGVRRTETAVPLEAPAPAALQLDSTDVAFVTGGAKGITAEMMFDLARTTGIRLVLSGSSPGPAAGTAPADEEMARTFRRFEAAGIEFRYVQCDVADAGAVRAAADRIQREVGPVTLLVHGAGITRFTRLSEKSDEEFRECVDVKVHGLYHLLQALPPSRLKGVHVLSSVLGRTGMRSQADYTFANAWLDRAVRQLAAVHPHLHALSLCYSVWEGTGLGNKLGALDFLKSVGVTPITVAEGVDAYVSLVRKSHRGSSFVITGRLSEDLEAQLYGEPAGLRGRYLERVRHFVPGTALVADAVLSFESDPYLLEHVFDGTPLMPGVMAIEAMTQAACAVTGADAIPVLRDIRFDRPLIVSGEPVTMRTVAFAGMPDEDGVTRVNVEIRGSTDGYRGVHFSAACLFGPVPASDPVAAAPTLGDALPISPDDFVPKPLFQGAFFRRIERIHRLERGAESVTTVRMPTCARYFGEAHDSDTRTPHPAARDAFLQSGALFLPHGSLPASIDELRFVHVPPDGTGVICHVTGHETGENGHNAGYRIFDTNGRLLEQMTGLVLRRPGAQRDPADEDAAAALLDLPDAVSARLSGIRHAIAVVPHYSRGGMTMLPDEVGADEAAQVAGRVAAPRRDTAVANLAAARRATLQVLRDSRLPCCAGDIELAAQADGKPLLRTAPASARVLEELDISLADDTAYSVAFLGPGPVGVDIEPVESRGRELWRALLGADGFMLAGELTTVSGEPFDVSATRVWTLIEAGKKANDLARIVPGGVRDAKDGWFTWQVPGTTERLTLHSIVTRDTDHGKMRAVAFAYGCGSGEAPRRIERAARVQDRPDHAENDGPNMRAWGMLRQVDL